METVPNETAPGDWIEVNGLPGHPSRRGEVIEVLGEPRHVHFRVRWEDGHESLLYPEHHEAIVHHAGNRRETL
ncbi:MAG TPA: DUF1918 domain-containing protein [Solirubrobacteraceae bacterium]|nr:DUF1918 domain-containing protein [Solirubrobacteraceae bacterium]